MAIDTANEKLALLELDQPYEPGLPLSPGTFGTDDKQQLLWGYITVMPALDIIAQQTAPAVSHYRNIDANAEDEIKSSAGVLYWLHAVNLTSTVAYVHLYDSINVTPGETVPDYTFPVPPQDGFPLPFGANGQAFANGITLVCTTTLDGSAGDPNGVIVNAGYT